MKHTAEFIKALHGVRGELDAWLECNNEAECRAAILGAIEEAREEVSGVESIPSAEVSGAGTASAGLTG